MATHSTDSRAPMAAAPMKYLPDGTVDWGNMWDTFCVLARDGGPPHRGTLLVGDPHGADTPAYRAAAAEIVRGIGLVSALDAAPAAPGWIAVRCASPGMARWLAESIQQENVDAQSDGALLLVPCAAHYTLKGEIKNVITAVAKTTHFWREHLPPDVKRALAAQDRLAAIADRARAWLRLGATPLRTTEAHSGSPAGQEPSPLI